MGMQKSAHGAVFVGTKAALFYFTHASLDRALHRPDLACTLHGCTWLADQDQPRMGCRYKTATLTSFIIHSLPATPT